MAIAGWNLYGTFGGGILLMGATLSVMWNGICGIILYRKRDRIREIVRLRLRSDPRLTFVIFATLLALLEEVITTSLTNMAPLFGNSHSFVTASGNYFEVVLFHSVIVFVPMFVVWAWLLGRYRFSPQSIFLLFGLNGVAAEALIGGGIGAGIAAPFWIFIYGLMVFLPAYCFDSQKFPQRGQPQWYHYPLAVGACFLASAIVAVLVALLSPHVPHFGTELIPPQ